MSDLIMVNHCIGPILDVRNAIGFAPAAQPRKYGARSRGLLEG